jgi:hypothetical protein
MLHGHGMNNHGFQLICIYIAGDKLFLNVSTSYYFYRIKWQIYHICQIASYRWSTALTARMLDITLKGPFQSSIIKLLCLSHRKRLKREKTTTYS